MRLFSGNSTELYLIKLHDYMGSYIRDFRNLAATVRVNIRDIVPMLDRNNIRIINEKEKNFGKSRKMELSGFSDAGSDYYVCGF